MSSSPTFLFIWWLINDARLQYVSHWRQKATAILIIPCHGDDSAGFPNLDPLHYEYVSPIFSTLSCNVAAGVSAASPHPLFRPLTQKRQRPSCVYHHKTEIGGLEAYLMGGRRRSVQHPCYLHSNPLLYELHVESDQLRPVRLNFKHSDSVYRCNGCSSCSSTR